MKEYGNFIIDPASGELASGLEGKGRMQEPENIVEIIIDYFSRKKKLLNKTFLVTAGPTYEKIDPVRFIGNYSSGKMGYAIAEELADEGASIILVSGPVSVSTSNKNIKVIQVESAFEMYSRCMEHFPNVDGAVMSAAVADFTPLNVDAQKTKWGKTDWELKLKPTEDIAKRLGEQKSEEQILVGFALETVNEKENAQKKLRSKNFDFIVLNSLNDSGAGFGVDTNKITIIGKDNNQEVFELKSKKEVARDIVRKIISLMA